MDEMASIDTTPYPLTLQLGMKRFYGHLILTPERLYFICGKKGGAWAAAIGQGLGGLVGGAITAMGTKNPGDAPEALDTAELERAVAENEGSLIMEPSEIEMIKHTLWMRLIRWNGKKFGLPNGLSKPLRSALGEWTRAHGVQTKGLK